MSSQQQPKPISVSKPHRPLDENIRDEARLNNPTYSHLFSAKYIPFNPNPSHQTPDESYSHVALLLRRLVQERMGPSKDIVSAFEGNSNLFWLSVMVNSFWA